ncbi:hypothetical protein [Methylobacterium sp. Leaf399]|uniref:hypothetical protein n=1 Tax=Methylobacterium sp. Leaf399 TaxID=1736364 RepID=UPI000AC0E023|nr:hypothetical protein [Methylobacterium sp. Leaf399]
MAQTPPPRYSAAELVAELREAAEEIAPELNGIRAEETLEGESAQMIEEMADALRRIANGAPRPQDLARAALDPQGPLKPFGKPKTVAASKNTSASKNKGAPKTTGAPKTAGAPGSTVVPMQKPRR